MGNCSSTSNCDPCTPDSAAINQLVRNAANYARQSNTYSVNAQNAAQNAEDYWEEFNALYLGAFSAPPTADNQGNPLQNGALYWDLNTNSLFAWDGSSWISATSFNEFTLFDATGTTYSRNLVTRTADIVNVKDFGAIGDGVADDTAAIQAAITAAGTSKTIWFPSGVYYITQDLTFPCQVVFDGVFTNTAALNLDITGDILRPEDYLKFFCGTDWNDFNAASATSQTRALQQLVNSFVKRKEYTTLDLGGRKFKLNATIEFNFNDALQSIAPYSVGIYRLKTICNGQLWSDGVSNGDPLLRLYDSTGGRIQGVEFNNINMVCRFESSGILLSGWNSWNRISGCHIEFPRYFGIKQDSQDGSGLRIEQCIIAGREYDVDDASREAVGIWLETNDVYVSDTDVSYFKKCVYSNNGNNFFVNCHFWNDSTHNNSPIIEIPPSVSRCVIDGCYLDNGPVWVGRGLEGPGNNFTVGHIAITDCIIVKIRRGTADFLTLYPNRTGTRVQGVIVQNCQFNNGSAAVPTQSIIRSGSTVTVTATDHRNIVGDYINIANAVPADYNGTWLITNVVDQDTFEFDIGSLTPINATTQGEIKTLGRIGAVNTTNGAITTGANTAMLDCFIDNNTFNWYLRQGTHAIKRIETNALATSYPIDWSDTIPFDCNIRYVNNIGVRSDSTTPVSVWYDYTSDTAGALEINPAFDGFVIVQANTNDFPNETEA